MNWLPARAENGSQVFVERGQVARVGKNERLMCGGPRQRVAVKGIVGNGEVVPCSSHFGMIEGGLRQGTDRSACVLTRVTNIPKPYQRAKTVRPAALNRSIGDDCFVRSSDAF